MKVMSVGNQAVPIRTMVSDNVPASRHHGAPRHGNALLAGLLRCQRCGRRLTVRYTGAKHDIPRYSCLRDLFNNGEPRCITLGGLWVDDAIEAALLRAVEPGAIAAAAEAQAQAAETRFARHCSVTTKRRATALIGRSGNMMLPGGGHIINAAGDRLTSDRG